MSSAERYKIIRKKIKRDQYIRIKANENFYNFYKELKKYSNSNLMPQCQIDMIQSSKDQYYIFGTSVRWSQYAIEIFEKSTCSIEILPHDDGIELHKLEMFQMGQGYGTKFMNAFTQIAKKLNIKIYLIPADVNEDPNVDPQRRREFYHRFNFKRMKDSRYWVN